jgi:trehalose synthase
MLGRTTEPSSLGVHSLESYEALIGRERIKRILRKADKIRDLHVVHVSSTFYGGGVTEILTPLTLIMNTLGIETGWRIDPGHTRLLQHHEETAQCLAGECAPFNGR